MPLTDDNDPDGNPRIYEFDDRDGNVLRLSVEEARAMMELKQLAGVQISDQNRE